MRFIATDVPLDECQKGGLSCGLRSNVGEVTPTGEGENSQRVINQMWGYGCALSVLREQRQYIVQRVVDKKVDAGISKTPGGGGCSSVVFVIL
jgi:hypothetical protein